VKFDVGQLVITPKGEGLVTHACRTPGGVTTNLGTFPESMVTAWVNAAALKADPDLMEEWLDDDHEEPATPIVETIETHCTCGCGQCHRILHQLGDGRIVFRSPHLTITTACRCAYEECWCLS
jgi:hypothetical protein